MKRLLSFFIAVVCILSMTLVAFAAVPALPVIYTKDGMNTIGIFEFEPLIEEEKNFLRSILVDDSPYSFVILSGGLVKFILFPSNMTKTKAGIGYVDYMDSFYFGWDPSFNSSMKFMTFKYNSSSGKWTKYSSDFDGFGNTSGSIQYVISANILTTLSMSVPYGAGMVAPSWDWQISSKRPIQFEDDGGLDLVPPTSSSEPDDSSSSSSPPPNPDLPVIPPSDSEYVPYDTTVWNDFLKSVTTAIGSSANVGFVVFGIICSVLLLVAIVRRFTLNKNNN